MYAHGLVKEDGGQAAVVVHRHLHHLVGAQIARVAVRELLQQVGHLHLGKHVVAEAVVAQADRHARPQQRA